MALIEALDLARTAPTTTQTTTQTPTLVSIQNTLDLLFRLTVQQNTLIKYNHDESVKHHKTLARRLDNLEKSQSISLEKTNSVYNITMDSRRLQRKLRRIKLLAKDIKENPASKLEDVAWDIGVIKAKLPKKFRTVKNKIDSCEAKLTEIAEHSQIAAQYADYRQNLEDAKADFLVRQNT